MSTVYVLEPPTKGKVVLNTTHGPLDIELWPKEAPKAVRNFVQLCLEGYYDDTIFHRIIKDFLVQGGDPTGSGTGGESIYGSPFADEYHSRLRFKHRGLVACANAGKLNSNLSQFFITLDRCDWLDRKHTIFGKVTGDSIFNLSRLAELETDDNDRPLDPPPKIISVEVLWNPFEDIVPRAPARPAAQPAAETEKKQTKQKGVKKLNLLSFGEEAEEDKKELAAQRIKIRSSHDVLDDPRLLKEEAPIKESEPSEAKATRDVQLSVREALSSKKEQLQKEFGDDFPHSSAKNDADDDEDEASFDARMLRQILEKRKELGDLPPKPKPKPKLPNGSSSRKERESSAPRSDFDSDGGNKPRVEKLSLKKKGIGSEARAEVMANADADLQLLSEAERGRQLNKQKKRRLRGREDEVLAKLENFKASTFGKPVAAGGADDEDLSDWREVHLKFAAEPGKDRMSRKEDPNDYVVVDPLLEKGKEKFNRMQAKEKRRHREWAGKSLT
ncbi:peptidyl-prolyl cis-trans isomerase CYP57 [Punica granatum]|uniref:Peptidyl-prolyl cis-trans isomerase CYP57 n=1 Tax=Punica granatum TaxID=22663 RepID=A0A6P8BQP0_PUNGR|nr:peptidyl-prolyl cis-trans isomerase CYP57 [Punica granatum]XP_031372640.1 peptidyl-prolyl cis-trans isomerase CYP57 [Punica granatum]XP_031372649.1 peptidyl-prolyl cis-trans isomerase CYP57 [Punica granatum]XP_031372660.1 peptidyl-prolyl cis-trans isomerase CYP57 [Punica granatum]